MDVKRVHGFFKEVRMKTFPGGKNPEAAGRAGNIAGSQSGIALVAVLLIMVMLAFLGAAIIFTTSTEIKISRNTAGATQSFMMAEAGLSNAVDYIRNDLTWGPDLDEDGQTADDSATWTSQSQGSLDLGGGQSGAFTTVVYDNAGSYGRTANISGHSNNPYVALSDSDILVESTGTVGGVTRKVALVIRPNISAFDYATYSDGEFSGTGSGNNPGKFVGKLYGGESIQVQGNYNLTDATAQSPGNITPDCNSGKFAGCSTGVEEVVAPQLDFAYYQDQANFSTQQVFTMTPSVGSTSSCGANCTQWPVTFQVTTLGTSYTITSTMKAVKQTSGSYKDYYQHTVYWCSDKTWSGSGNCPGGAAPSTYSFYPDSKNSIESSKPFVNSTQFNAYTTATGTGYTSSVVNVFDATKHLEFLGPGVGQTTTITASILVGTASNNTEPVGKIDFEGGDGTINFEPANGLAVVAEKVEIKAKYGTSGITVNVGTADAGAVIIATKEFEVEAKTGMTANVTINGSLVIGDNTTDAEGEKGEFSVGGNGVVTNFSYVPVENLPQGWLDSGSVTIERREWREL